MRPRAKTAWAIVGLLAGLAGVRCGGGSSSSCTTSGDCGPGRLCVDGACRAAPDVSDVPPDGDDAPQDADGETADRSDSDADGEADTGPRPPECAADPDYEVVGRITVRAQQVVREQLPATETVAFRAGETAMIDGNWLPLARRGAGTSLAVLSCAGGTLAEVPFQAVRPGLPESAPLVFFRLVRDLAADGDGRVDRDYYLALRRSGDASPSARLLVSHYEFATNPPLTAGGVFGEEAPGWSVEIRGCTGCGARFHDEGFLNRNSLVVYCDGDECAEDSGVSAVSPPIPLADAAGEDLRLFSAVRLFENWSCGSGACTACRPGASGCRAMASGSRGTIRARFVDASGAVLDRQTLRADGPAEANSDGKFAFPTTDGRYENYDCDEDAFVAVPDGATAVRLELTAEGGPAAVVFDDVMLFRHAVVDRTVRCGTDAGGDGAPDPFPWEPVVEVDAGLKVAPRSRTIVDEVPEHGFAVERTTPVLFELHGGPEGRRHDRAVQLALEFLQERSESVLGARLPEVRDDVEPAAPHVIVGERDDAVVREHLGGRTVPTGGLDGGDGYLVVVEPERIVVAGSGARGTVYGAAALAELFPVERVGEAPGTGFALPRQEIEDAPALELRAVMVAPDAGDLEREDWSTTRLFDYLAYCRLALRSRFNAMLFGRTDVFALPPDGDGYARLLELIRACAADYLLEPIPMPFNPRGTIPYRESADGRHKVFVAAGRTMDVDLPVPATPGAEWIDLSLPFIPGGYRKNWPLTDEEVRAAGSHYRQNDENPDLREVRNVDDGAWYPYAECDAAGCRTAPVLTGQCPPDEDDPGVPAAYCRDPRPVLRPLGTIEIVDAGGTTLRLEDEDPEDPDFDYRLDGCNTYALRSFRPTRIQVRGRYAGQTLAVRFSYLPDDQSYLSTCLGEEESYRRIRVLLEDLAARIGVPLRFVHVGMDEMVNLGTDLRDERNTSCGDDHLQPCTDRGEALDYGVVRVRDLSAAVFSPAPPRVIMWGDMVMKIQPDVPGAVGPMDYLPRDVWMVPWHYHFSVAGRDYIGENVRQFGEHGLTMLGGPHVGNSTNTHLWARPYANVRIWAVDLAGEAAVRPAGVAGMIVTRYEGPGTGKLWDQSPLAIDGALAWRAF